MQTCDSPLLILTLNLSSLRCHLDKHTFLLLLLLAGIFIFYFLNKWTWFLSCIRLIFIVFVPSPLCPRVILRSAADDFISTSNCQRLSRRKTFWKAVFLYLCVNSTFVWESQTNLSFFKTKKYWTKARGNFLMPQVQRFPRSSIELLCVKHCVLLYFL